MLKLIKYHNHFQVLKVWDIDDHCCIQTVPLNFPSFSVLGKQIEFGTRSLYPGPSCGILDTTATQTIAPSQLLTAEARQWQRGQLLVCCCDHIATLRIAREQACVTPPPLPPPSREHHASVPSPWTAAEARGAVTPDIPSHEESVSRCF